MKNLRKELIDFNNLMALHQNLMPKEIIIAWNKIFEKSINYEKLQKFKLHKSSGNKRKIGKDF